MNAEKLAIATIGASLPESLSPRPSLPGMSRPHMEVPGMSSPHSDLLVRVFNGLNRG